MADRRRRFWAFSLRLFTTLAIILGLCTSALQIPRAMAQAPQTTPEPSSYRTPVPSLSLTPPSLSPDEAVPGAGAETPAPQPETSLIDVPRGSEGTSPAPAVAMSGAVLNEEPLHRGDRVQVALQIEAQQDLHEATLRFILPDGLALPDTADSALTVTAKGEGDQVVTWPISDLARGEAIDRNLELVLTEGTQDLTVLSVELWSSDAYGPAVAEVEVRRELPAVEAAVTAAEGGELRSADGRVTVSFPAGAVARDVRVVHRPVAVQRLQTTGADLVLQFELNAYTDDADRVRIESFEKPLELRVDLEGLIDLGSLQRQQHIFFGYWDEETQEWTSLSARLDGGNALVSTVEHFTLFGTGTSVGMNTGWVPTFNEANVSLFDGGLSYSYPIEVPDGVGGLRPDLSLTYNSRRVDGIASWVQADWLGLGWTVDTIEIVRDLFQPKYSWYPGGTLQLETGSVYWGNRYSLLYKGTRYPLIPSTPNARGRYHTQNDQFLYIERRNNTTICSIPGNPSPLNETGEYWIVRLQDGTEYRLGYTEDAEQTFYTWMYGLDYILECDVDVPESYAGHWNNRVAYRWRVDSITTTQGITMGFTYEEEQTSYPPTYYYNFRENASYLRKISYNRDPNTGRMQTEIWFDRATRGNDGSTLWNASNAYFFQRDYLDKVRIENWNGSSYETLREYRFTYKELEPPDPSTQEKHTRLLASITEYGRGGTGSLPPTTFDYVYRDNKEHATSGTSWQKQSFPYARLDRVWNGYGDDISATPTYSATYGTPDASDGSPWDRIFNYRVERIDATDGMGGGARTDYTYTPNLNERAYYRDSIPGCDYYTSSTTGGTFVGYRYVTETLKTLDDSLLASTAHTFFLESEDTVDARLNRELEVAQKDADGTILQRVATSWTKERTLDDTSGLNDIAVPDGYFVYASVISECVRVDDTLPPLSAPSKRTENQYQFHSATRYYCTESDYGHLIRKKEYDGSTLVRQTEYEPVVNVSLNACNLSPSGPWLTGYVAQQLVKDGAGTVLGGTRFIYDSQGSSYPSTPARGLVVRNEQLRNDSSDWIVTQRITYTQVSNAWYGPTETSDALGNTTQLVYDSAWWLYPEQSIDALGHVITGTFDYVLGQPLTVQQPSGPDTTVTYEYDSLGRVIKIIQPGDSSAYPTSSFTYSPGLAPWKIVREDLQTVGTTQTLATTQYYDGLGHPIQTQVANADRSQMVVSSRIYNAQGLVDTQYDPVQVAYASAYQTPSGATATSAYDALGRVISVTSPDSTATSTDYNGYSIAVLDANDHQRIHTYDALGRLAATDEFTGTYQSADWDATAYATTLYAYNALNALTTLTNTDGITTTMAYDLLGRKTAMHDPDMGDWSYEYDTAGNLIRQEDARHKVVCFYYDALNRLTGKYYCDDCARPAAPSYDVEYHYDTTDAGSYGIGLLHYTYDVDADITRSYRYDARGRVTATWQPVGAYGLAMEWSYNAADQVVTVKYPTDPAYARSETVTTTYDAWARPATLTSVVGGITTTLVTDATYDPYGRPNVLQFGDGYRTDYDYYAATQDGGRLQSIKTGNASPYTQTQYLTWDYDAVGNVASITDGANGGQVQSFTYDALDRLTAASTNAAGAGQYNHSYAYNAVGNITSLAGVAYSYSNAAHVHAVSGLNCTPCSAEYGYDANGNMTTRPWQGSTQTLSYDYENRLAGVSGAVTATLAYDGQGNRVIRQMAGETRVYLEDWFESDTSFNYTCYYYFGGQRVAQRTSAGTTYLHADHLGSTSETTGQATSEQLYYPYGAQRTAAQVTANYRYTGQRWESAIGLYDYKARYYDPALGRFIQPDSIVPEPQDAQSLNRYSYVRNNPVRFSDPTGHWDYVDVELKNDLNRRRSYLVNRFERDWFDAVLSGGKEGAYPDPKSYYPCLPLSARNVWTALHGTYEQLDWLESTRGSGPHSTVAPSHSSNADPSVVELAGGLSTVPIEIAAATPSIHHFFTNKHTTYYTAEFEAIVGEYGLSLNDSWNTERLPQNGGRHAEEYNAWALGVALQIDADVAAAQGGPEMFLELFDVRVRQEVRAHPEMLGKHYWTSQ